jgi:hypothetical protein
MAGLAEQYYNLIWKAVREGARVVEDVFGSDRGFEAAYARALESRPSIAHRFFVVSCYVARRILTEMLESLPDLPEACDVVSAYSEDIIKLASMLERDLKNEIIEYNIKDGIYRLAISVLKSLETLARGVVGYCALSGLEEV